MGYLLVFIDFMGCYIVAFGVIEYFIDEVVIINFIVFVLFTYPFTEDFIDIKQ
jgi:hypothetical protein